MYTHGTHTDDSFGICYPYSYVHVQVTQYDAHYSDTFDTIIFMCVFLFLLTFPPHGSCLLWRCICIIIMQEHISVLYQDNGAGRCYR